MIKVTWRGIAKENTCNFSTDYAFVARKLAVKLNKVKTKLSTKTAINVAKANPRLDTKLRICSPAHTAARR